MVDNSLHRGVEDIAVTETELSDIDGENGSLIIRGIPIKVLANNATFEECCYLLFNDRLPTETQLATFQKRLSEHRQLPDRVSTLLSRAAAEAVHPMDAVRMGVAALDLDGKPPAEQAVRLVAVLPTIVAAYWRYRAGEAPVEPRTELRHAENYLYMHTGTEPEPAVVDALEAYLIAVIDHGLNASTFVARSIVSTESDLVSAITGAVGALKGPRHGGAPGPVLETLRTVATTGSPTASVESVLESGNRLMGFGHRVYRTRDPRAAVLASVAERLDTHTDGSTLFETASSFEAVAREKLAAHHPDRRLETNVEFYTAVVLDGIDIPPALFTPTFAVSRVVGWTTHCLEELEDPKLVRPTARYTGKRDRGWTPRSDR
ncbi:citrate synthase [Halocatena halophila]|uniref:citrate synthase n=1 Tax=Halocatena halophila TaxID=2814576 RepID=UPI002ED53ADC